MNVLFHRYMCTSMERWVTYVSYQWNKDNYLNTSLYLFVIIALYSTTCTWFISSHITVLAKRAQVFFTHILLTAHHYTCILKMGWVLVVCKMYLLFLSHIRNTDGHPKFTVFNLLFYAAILYEFSLRDTWNVILC